RRQRESASENLANGNASGVGAPRAAASPRAEAGVGPRANSLRLGRGSAPDPRETERRGSAPVHPNLASRNASGVGAPRAARVRERRRGWGPGRIHFAWGGGL